MKIKILETILDGRNRYEVDEVRNVSDETGRYFCENGWAEDVAGEVLTGERNVNARRLDVRSTTHDSNVSGV